jgi:hypothetical protein
MALLLLVLSTALVAYLRLLASGLRTGLRNALAGGGCRPPQRAGPLIRVDIARLDSRAYGAFMGSAEAARAIRGYVSVRKRGDLRIPRAWLARVPDLTITSQTSLSGEQQKLHIRSLSKETSNGDSRQAQ